MISLKFACVIGWFHPKNLIFLNYHISKNYNRVNTIEEADIVFSGDTFIDTSKYKTKLFLFGPHFSVFPSELSRKLNGDYYNAVYIQPSISSAVVWKDEFKFDNIPVVALPFGVDTDKFYPKIKEESVVVYYKDRSPLEFNFLINFLNHKKINYKLFDYRKSYQEHEYLNALQTAKYMIVLGRHESQGFAIQEAMSCDVPLFVWDVDRHDEEWSHRIEYKDVNSKVTSVPYWSKVCGIKTTDPLKISKLFEEFLSKIHTYSPRKFILENLSMKTCDILWKNKVIELKNKWRNSLYFIV